MVRYNSLESSKASRGVVECSRVKYIESSRAKSRAMVHCGRVQ